MTAGRCPADGVRMEFAHHQVERLKEAGLMDPAREMSAQGTRRRGSSSVSLELSGRALTA